MACGCKSKGNPAIVWRVTYRDGRAPEEYLTEVEARAAANIGGGVYTRAAAAKAAK